MTVVVLRKQIYVLCDSVGQIESILYSSSDIQILKSHTGATDPKP